MGLPADVLAAGMFQPLARAVPKMLLEERFHTEHAEGWVRVIESGGGAPREALAEALARALRDVAAFFGPPGHDTDLVESGARTTNDEALRGRLFARIAGLLEDPARVGLRRDGDGWTLAESEDWAAWSADRRRPAAGGPDQAMLDELRGTKNVAFKSA